MLMNISGYYKYIDRKRLIAAADKRHGISEQSAYYAHYSMKSSCGIVKVIGRRFLAGKNVTNKPRNYWENCQMNNWSFLTEVDYLDKEKMTYGFDKIKKMFSLKRTKATLYMAAVLWLAVITQLFINKLFHEDFQITEAFVKTNAQEMKSSIEVVAQYDAGFLSEADKKNVIQSLADAIGLTIDRDISVEKEGNRSEYSFVKKAKQASSEIKVISMEQEEDAAIKMRHYIIVRLSIYESIENIDRYKKIIEDTLKKSGVDTRQITMQFEGNFDGPLSAEMKKKTAASLVDELQGEIVSEYDEGDIYTVYAYTGLINEYITSVNSKVNIQIAMTYNEITDKTKVTMATPILNQSW